MTQLEKLMKLGMTEAEARQVIADDKAIDKGAKLFELTDEQKKFAKKYTNSGTHEVKETTKKVSRTKANPEKEQLIAAFGAFLTDFGADLVEITNKSREITFKIGENDYKLALTATRKPKS